MTSWARRILILNVAAFFASAVLMPPWLVDQFVLIPNQLAERPWTILTYQFLHAGVMHLLFNMLGLYFFGPRLEERIGSKHFIFLYLLSGAMGALLSIATPDARIIGASGSVFGVLLGFARYWPRERIYIYALIPVEARLLVVFLAALSLWSGLGPGADRIAHFAHLGGFLGGWIYLKVLERNSPARRFKQTIETAMTGGSRPSAKDLDRWAGINPGGLHPINRAEYERVLEKAKELGVSALTIQERAFMERFVSG